MGIAVLLLLALALALLVAERVLRRARPATRTGIHAPWRHPGSPAWARAVEILANGRVFRALLEPLPVLALRSDITDVVYVNYIVPAERLAPLVPEGLELQRIGPGDRYALFTFLTYRHGHFGPRFLGSLRRLFPSPIQSNWRVHVVDPARGVKGVHFITTAISSTIHALGARLCAEGTPMHVPARADLRREADGTMRLTLSPGRGTAPDAELVLRPAEEWRLPEAFSACFAGARALLEYCVPQDRAMASQPWRGTISRQEIHLGIPLSACEPLAGEVRSRAAEAIAGDAVPVCFRVARVDFLLEGEWHEALRA